MKYSPLLTEIYRKVHQYPSPEHQTQHQPEVARLPDEFIIHQLMCHHKNQQCSQLCWCAQICTLFPSTVYAVYNQIKESS